MVDVELRIDVSLFLENFRLVKVGINLTLYIFEFLRWVVRITLVKDSVLMLLIEYSFNA